MIANTANVTQQLPLGFVEIGPVGMRLDVQGLSEVIDENLVSLRKAWGSRKVERLLAFCNENLSHKQTVMVTVVAKTIRPGAKGHVYLCFCEGSDEPYSICSLFVSEVNPDNGCGRTSIPVRKTQQKRVAYATR